MKYSQETIDNYRNVNVDHEWWDSTYDYWKTVLLPTFGIRCDEIHFSGFGSQGDGASFTGYVENFNRFITLMTGSGKSYPLWRKHGEMYFRSATIKFERIDSHYSHECTVTCNVSADRFQDRDDDEFMYEIHKVWDDVIERELMDFEKECQTFARAIMRRIYCELEAEYEHLTSDEAVIDWLEANGVEPDFDEVA